MASPARAGRHRTVPVPSAARVGARVRRLREEAGFTFDAFVEELGLGRGYVSELERGLVVPSLTALERIAAVCGVTVADLVIGTSARENLFARSRWLEPSEVERLAAAAETMLEARVDSKPPARLRDQRHSFREVSERAARTMPAAVPLLRLRPAAGAWSTPQAEGVEAYVVLPLRTRSKRGLFVAQVTGSSMEPTVPDGAYCLFERPWQAPRAGELGLFVRWATEQEGSFTLKEYRPRKQETTAGSEVGGALVGHNRMHPPLRHRAGAEAPEQPFARWLRVLHGGAAPSGGAAAGGA